HEAWRGDRRGQAKLRVARPQVDRTAGDHALVDTQEQLGVYGLRCLQLELDLDVVSRPSDSRSVYGMGDGHGLLRASRRGQWYVGHGHTARQRIEGWRGARRLPAIGQQDDLGVEGAVTLDDAAGQVERGTQVRAPAGWGLR